MAKRDEIEVLTAARLWAPMMESLHGAFRVHDRIHQSDAAAFAAAAPRIRAIAASGESKVPRELIAQLPALEIISVFGVGYDSVDVTAAASAASPSPTRRTSSTTRSPTWRSRWCWPSRGG